MTRLFQLTKHPLIVFLSTLVAVWIAGWTARDKIEEWVIMNANVTNAPQPWEFRSGSANPDKIITLPYDRQIVLCLNSTDVAGQPLSTTVTYEYIVSAGWLGLKTETLPGRWINNPSCHTFTARKVIIKQTGDSVRGTYQLFQKNG